MATVDQPTPNPTNKLTAATVASSLIVILGFLIRKLFPDWYDPEVIAALTPFIIFGIGYIVRDHATTHIVVVDKEGNP